MKKRRELPNIAFLDLLWNALLGFVVLFVLAFTQMSAKTAEHSIETGGEFVIKVTWDDKSEDDVDTYVMDPHGEIVFFLNRERGLMHLERDDLGASNDYVVEKGQKIQIDKNEERIILRGIVPGEYIVNVHMYRKRDTDDAKVKVALIKLRGRDTPVTDKEIVLRYDGHEVTAFRFTLESNGNVSNINDLQRNLIGSVERRRRRP